MRGLMVVNGFFKSAVFDALYADLFRSAEKCGIKLIRMTNEALCPIDERLIPDGTKFVLYWDKDVRLARQLEMTGLPVFNTPKAIQLCDDKTLTYLALRGVCPMPETILSPLSFFDYDTTDFLDRVAERLTYPYVMKEGHGSFGAQVYLIHKKEEALQVLKKIGERPALFQKYIAESAGRDIRIYVVGKQCIAAMERYSLDGDFRANIGRGGGAKTHVVTKEEERIALQAVEKLDLAFAGVDLLTSKDGPLLCEVNSNAHFAGLARVTGICPSDAIMAEIKAQCLKNL